MANATDHLWMHFTRMSSYRDNDGADHRPRRGLLRLGLARPSLPRRPGRALRGQRRPRPHRDSPRPPPSRPPSWRTSRSGRTPTRRRSSWPTGSPSWRPATSTGSSSPPAAPRPSRPPGSSRAPTSSGPASPTSTRSISRYIAYHGTSMGALSITGLPGIKSDFEPLVPGGIKVPNTNFYRAPEHGDDAGGVRAVGGRRDRRAIEREGPDTVAAVFLEPVQNSGGCFPPPPGYFQRVREICDAYDVLLVSDEVICAWGRLGEYFGAENATATSPTSSPRAKGLTSGYAPLGAMIASDRLIEPFLQDTNMFAHGVTFGGHPVSCAVALANLDVFAREDLVGHVRANADAFRSTLEKLLRPADRRRRPRRRLLLRHRAGQGQGHPGDVRRGRVRAAAARLPLPGAVRGRPLLPGRRPWRPGHPAGPAADRRAGRVRRDGADPALRAHRGVRSCSEVSAERTRIRRLPEKAVTERADLGRDPRRRPGRAPRHSRRRAAVRAARRLCPRRRPGAGARLDRQPAVPGPGVRRGGLPDRDVGGRARAGPQRVRVVDALPLGDGARPGVCRGGSARRPPGAHRAPAAGPLGGAARAAQA